MRRYRRMRSRCVHAGGPFFATCGGFLLKVWLCGDDIPRGAWGGGRRALAAELPCRVAIRLDFLLTLRVVFAIIIIGYRKAPVPGLASPLPGRAAVSTLWCQRSGRRVVLGKTANLIAVISVLFPPAAALLPACGGDAAPWPRPLGWRMPWVRSGSLLIGNALTRLISATTSFSPLNWAGAFCSECRPCRLGAAADPGADARLG